MSTATAQRPMFVPTWEVTALDTTLHGLVVDIHHPATNHGTCVITTRDAGGAEHVERVQRGATVCLLTRS